MAVPPPPPPISIPGETIGSATKYTAGPGTHIHNGQLCASTLGPVVTETPTTTTFTTTSSSKTNNTTKKDKKPLLPLLSISRSSGNNAVANVLPEVDAVVLARVTRINPRQANVAILVVGETVCADEFPGIIRYVLGIVKKKDERSLSVSLSLLGMNDCRHIHGTYVCMYIYHRSIMAN